MFDLNSIFEFSRDRCVAICSFLVPLNLIATSSTLLLLLSKSSLPRLRTSVIFASVCALTLFLHVGTWLMVGVVMAPTFILFGLGSICLTINLWVLLAPQGIPKLSFFSHLSRLRDLKWLWKVN